MSKARDLADLIAAGNPLADGTVEVADISDLTATAAELNLMDGVTATTAELNYVDGVTSNIQTQLDAKGTVSSLSDLSVTATATELNYNDITTLGTVEASKTVTADSSGNVKFNDWDELQFGHSGDLKIYHTGAHSVIKDAGSGNLYIQGSPLISLTNTNTSEAYADFNENGAVNLYYDNTSRFSTTSNGVYVNGTANVSTLALNGVSVTATAAELNYNDITTLGTSQASKVLTADANGDVVVSEEFRAKSYNETYVSLTAAATVDINCETGNYFSLSTDQNTTFTFSNPPATGTGFVFILEITQGGAYTLTWPSAVAWAGGAAPDAPGSSEVAVYAFATRDGGTTWYGFQAGTALA